MATGLLLATSLLLLIWQTVSWLCCMHFWGVKSKETAENFWTVFKVILGQISPSNVQKKLQSQNVESWVLLPCQHWHLGSVQCYWETRSNVKLKEQHALTWNNQNSKTIFFLTHLLLQFLAVISRFGPHWTIVIFVTQNNFKNGPGISNPLLGFYPIFLSSSNVQLFPNVRLSKVSLSKCINDVVHGHEHTHLDCVCWCSVFGHVTRYSILLLTGCTNSLWRP